MERNELIIEAICKQRILPLFYHSDKEICLSIVQTLYAAGFRVIEFTNRGPDALANFKAIVAARNESMKDLLLAIGTIKTADQATKYMDAGADLLISPIFDADVADVAYLNKVLWLPGCMTPTEIQIASNAGCKLVKLFPGNVLGPGFVSSIKELFPEMLFMPTGGVEVNKENIAAWFDAGVCAVGLGSKLITKDILDRKDFNKLGDLAKDALAIVAGIKR